MKYYYYIKENPISLNKVYSTPHWTVRSKLKSKWFDIFKEYLDANPPSQIEKYNITLTVNSRLDPSNCIMVIKFFEDTLKKLDYIVDDSPKYCKSITIKPDENLEKKSFTLILERLD